MKKIVFFISLIITVSCFYSCNNDVNLATDWHETTVIYSLLNVDDSISYIKVNKAFLGNENAMIMASIRDSSEYSNISVKLEKYLNGHLLETMNFEPIEIDDKDSGYFYNPKQTVYAAVTKGKLKGTYSINPDTLYTYKVVVTNNSGETVTAETALVRNSVFINKPIAPSGKLPSINFIDNAISVTKIEWDTVPLVGLYNLGAEFFFWEINTSGDTTLRSIKWEKIREIAGDIHNAGAMEISVNCTNFYNLCMEKIPYIDPQIENTIVKRRPGIFALKFKMAGRDYYKYTSVNNITSGLSQEIPLYSNVHNGIGLVSSRALVRYDCQLSEQTKNSLFSNADYDALKFVNW